MNEWLSLGTEAYDGKIRWPLFTRNAVLCAWLNVEIMIAFWLCRWELLLSIDTLKMHDELAVIFDKNFSSSGWKPQSSFQFKLHLHSKTLFFYLYRIRIGNRNTNFSSYCRMKMSAKIDGTRSWWEHWWWHNWWQVRVLMLVWMWMVAEVVPVRWKIIVMWRRISMMMTMCSKTKHATFFFFHWLRDCRKTVRREGNDCHVDSQNWSQHSKT